MQMLDVEKEDDSTDEYDGVVFNFINLKIEVVEISHKVEGGEREIVIEQSENEIVLYRGIDDDLNNYTNDEEKSKKCRFTCGNKSKADIYTKPRSPTINYDLRRNKNITESSKYSYDDSNEFFSGSSVEADDSHDELDGVSVSSSERIVESDDSYDALDEVSVSSSVSIDNLPPLVSRSEVSLVSKVSDEDSVDSENLFDVI